ncbi:hypothetical protein ACFWNK_10665 [Streptomyces sp. NPDC058417]|uniref:hypothetical protein n=1 Tax=unclassified Streptomyces TaxID=2593676 RepID=UPI00365A6A38
MSEHRNTPPPAAPRSGRRGRAASVAGATLLALAVLALVTTTVVTVRGADRDPGAPTWTFPRSGGGEKSAAQEGLAGLLLPYGAGGGWTRGPDIEEFGADVQLDGARSTAVEKRPFRDLPRAQRRELEKRIDKLKIRGTAMRSYYSQEPDVYSKDDVFAVNVVLTRMEDRAAVRDLVTTQADFMDAADGFVRRGPVIEGHRGARCFLSEGATDDDLDTLFCTAYAADVFVSTTARAPHPIDTEAVAGFVRAQLDRVAPGEAV